MRSYLLVCSALLLSCTHAGNSNPDYWAEFVGAPTAENERLLLNAIGDDVGKCDWGKKENQAAIPDSYRQDLFDLIASGDEPSLRVGLGVEKCLDGGDLGDFRRNAGFFFDSSPDLFVDEMLKQRVSQERFVALITRLPLSLTDNTSGQAKLVESRIVNLERLQALEGSPLVERGKAALGELARPLAHSEE